MADFQSGGYDDLESGANSGAGQEVEMENMSMEETI